MIKMPLHKLHDCLKYHSGSYQRTKLLRDAYAIDYGRVKDDDIAGMIMDALNAGCRIGLYNDKRRVYCEQS